VGGSLTCVPLAAQHRAKPQAADNNPSLQRLDTSGHFLRRTATSRHKKKLADIEEPVPARPTPGPGPELLRRGLLSFITALVVARPFVPGEDPGRTLLDTGAGNQVLTFLWLLALVGWAAWRAWSQYGTWHGSLVEVALLAVAVLSFISARDAAAFKHPAWLLAWEWFGLFTAFFLVRQLVRTPRENQGLFAAILATGVCLSAYAVYQWFSPAVPPPPPDQTVADIFDLDREHAVSGGEPEAKPAPSVSATFMRPQVFCSFLFLLLPPLVAGVIRCFRTSGTKRHALLTGLCLALSLGALTVSALTTAHFSGPGLHSGAGAAWALIRAHPWTGIGPGNFSREVVSVFPEAPALGMTLPDNFVLEIGATCGITTVAALFVAFGAFFWYTRNESVRPPVEGSEDTPVVSYEPPWEFYTGGILGLTLGFMLALPEPGKADLLREGAVAACRSLVWFAAFAVLSSVPWTRRAVTASISYGVLVLLCVLLIGDGISYPSLVLPMWALMAIALNTIDAGWTWENHNWVGLVVPMPLLALVALTFGLLALHPAVNSTFKVAQARRYYPQWRDEMEPLFQRRLKEANDPPARYRVVQLVHGVLWHRILGPLRRAAQDDPGNPYVLTESAYWLAKEWQVLNEMTVVPQEEWVPRERGSWPKDYVDARKGWDIAVREAQQADPNGKEAYWIAYLCRDTIFAEGVKKTVNNPTQTAKDLRDQLTFAANNLYHVATQIDPTNPRLRLLLADLVLKVNDESAPAKAKEQAREAQRLNEETTDPRRRLSVEQQGKIRDWLFTDKKP
jgi:hypothetical protein